LYGQFIEHIGGTMYGSLWAEMLDDRKFYFPITAKKPEPAARPQGGPFGMRLRQWHPVGGESAVVMDKERPFVGDQSPRIKMCIRDSFCTLRIPTAAWWSREIS